MINLWKFVDSVKWKNNEQFNKLNISKLEARPTFENSGISIQSADDDFPKNRN